MTLNELLSQYEGKFCSINDCGVVPDGEPNLDVAIWESEEEAETIKGEGG